MRWFVVPLLVLVASLDIAAAPADDLSRMRVKPGDELQVLLGSGLELSGRFRGATSQALVLTGRDGRDQTLGAGDITAVWKQGDSLKNGAIIGGVVGLLGGIFGQSTCTRCDTEIVVGVGIGVPFWAGVGALVDKAREGRTLVYQRPP